MLLWAPQVFDGERLWHGAAVAVESGRIAAVTPGPVPAGARVLEGLLSPGFVDLQANGGAGHQVDGAMSPEALRAMLAAHARAGTTGVLPTLITDTPAATAAVVDLGAAAAGMPGFLGLHLEGPHLDPRRKGAHDAALIRPMAPADAEALVDARARLPALLVTLAPAAAPPAMVARLAAGGVTVSLGHADCTLAEAQEAAAAGATVATHLFNAMSPLGHREPGLVGAVLSGAVARAGLIADGIHVAPPVLRIALAARPRGLFLVTDCMAPFGTALDAFTLNGRTILRRDGRLTLADGTLAGADTTLPAGLRLLVQDLGVPPARALSMVTAEPADAIGAPAGRLRAGRSADMVLLAPDWSVAAVWQGGAPVPPA